jgi:16S rRNA (guanine1207-N2)-methyltransferase
MGSQYFDVDPSVPLETASVPLTVDDRTVSLTSGSGVFGWRRVDPGSAALIKYAPPPPAGDVLDLGCGYGPITVALALRAPESRIWALDVNRRALELTRANAAALELANVTAVEAADLPADVRFAAIYSNPPIKVGKGTMQDLLRTWLARLRPDGHAYLVVKQSMGSESLVRWLAEGGWASERLRSKNGYRVLDVTAAR